MLGAKKFGQFSGRSVDLWSSFVSKKNRKTLNQLRIWKGNYYCCKWRWMRPGLKLNFREVSSYFDDYELKFYLLILWFSGEFFSWMSLMNERALSIPRWREYIRSHIYRINSLENKTKIVSTIMKKDKILLWEPNKWVLTVTLRAGSTQPKTLYRHISGP